MLKQKLLSPILQTIFPVLTAAPPPGELDPEDEENDDSGDDIDNENPKHSAAQVGKNIICVALVYSLVTCSLLKP